MRHVRRQAFVCGQRSFPLATLSYSSASICHVCFSQKVLQQAVQISICQWVLCRIGFLCCVCYTADVQILLVNISSCLEKCVSSVIMGLLVGKVQVQHIT